MKKSNVIVLKRETALKQMLEAVSQIDKTKEVCFDTRCFDGHEEEGDSFYRLYELAMVMKTRSMNIPFLSIDMRNAS